MVSQICPKWLLVSARNHRQVKSHLFPNTMNSPASCGCDSAGLQQAVGAQRRRHYYSSTPLSFSPPDLFLLSLARLSASMMPPVAAAQARGRKLIWPERFPSCPWEEERRKPCLCIASLPELSSWRVENCRAALLKSTLIGF